MTPPNRARGKKTSASGHFAKAQAFVRSANRATTLDELSGFLKSCTHAFGFDYFALFHHVDHKLEGPEVVRLSNYPAVWMSLQVERNYFVDNPIHAACRRSVTGFFWSEVGTLLRLTARHREILAAAGDAGLGDGFTIPVHIPGEFPGSCSFVVRAGRVIDKSAIPAIYYMGSFAFEAARRIVVSTTKQNSPEAIAASKSPGLTQRQFDCVVLAAQGKSDWDIAQLLGISPETVHQHMEDAKRRYQVSTRMQLVVRTLFDSQLSFSDVLR